jgi:hypothetical protein
LTELWSKNQFLEAILKTAAILEQSKNQLGLKLEVVVHILKSDHLNFDFKRKNGKFYQRKACLTVVLVHTQELQQINANFFSFFNKQFFTKHKNFSRLRKIEFSFPRVFMF